MNNTKILPCGKTNCMFCNCINLVDDKNDVLYDVAPCMSLGECPNRYGIIN